MLHYENILKKQGFSVIIGVDEAGRGPLAGPVLAAAVVLKQYDFRNRIDDSKKLTPAARLRAFPEIIERSVFGVGLVDEKTIDRVNILVATRMAMEQAITRLIDKIKPLDNEKIHVIIDGNMSLGISLPYTSIIKGDGKSLSIAAASILAKVIRDRIMTVYGRMYPEYGFMQHKGYGTAEHMKNIKRSGMSPIHRKSFCSV